MEPIEMSWRIFLAIGAAGFGVTTMGLQIKGMNGWAILGIEVLYTGATVILALTAALGRLPW